VPIRDYCIAQEQHADGTLHLHAFIRYAKRISFDLKANPRIFDIGGHHGNYAAAKSWENVLKYCQKGGNYISNFSPDAALAKKAARNLQLLNEDPKQLISEGTIGVLQLPSLLKARDLHQTLNLPYESADVRGVWITGLSGVGKSHFVRSRHQSSTLYLKSPKNRWFCGYSGQPYILIDDFDHTCVSFSCDLKLWADKWGCTAETKGGKVNLMHTTLYVTSQYTIDDLWHGNEHQELRDALNRRFRTIHIEKGFGFNERADELDN